MGDIPSFVPEVFVGSVSSFTDRWVPRRMFLLVSSENHRSTRFIHDA